MTICLQGICYDDKSSYLQGPKLAPPLIRKALYSDSSNLFTEHGKTIEKIEIIDEGDFAISDYFEIETITANHLNKNTRLISLGGDHSITYPLIKAHHALYPKLDILHIDAHGDLYHHFEGDPYSHACPFARIMENGLASNLVQVGIRTLNDHQREQAAKFDVEIIEMKDYALSKVPGFENPLYISLDMDAFDPSVAPGVSHYEPGGFSARQLLDLILSLDAEIIGADIVEYNPTRDINDMTAFLAAKLLKEIMIKMG